MLVKVINDNVHPYQEKFRGKDIYIAPKGSVEMDINDANIFLGTMPANIEVDGGGTQKPTSYKMLRIEQKGSAPKETSKTYVCMADGREFPTQSALDAYIAENHVDAMIDEKAQEEVIKKKMGRPFKTKE